VLFRSEERRGKEIVVSLMPILISEN